MQSPSANSGPGRPGPVKKGYLTKEGGSVKTWKRRYFALLPTSISYGKSDLAKPIKTIMLRDVSLVEPETYKTRTNCFRLVTGKRTFHISAESDADMKSWVSAIRSCMAGIGRGGALEENAPVPSMTPLHRAADAGELEALRSLLKQSLTRIDALDEQGNTPLFLACERGHRKPAVELLKAGARVTIVNRTGSTVLHATLQATFWTDKHTKILEQLLARPEIAVNALNKDNFTALQLACGRGNYDAARLLLKAKADPTIVKAGEPPLFSAVYAENPALVRELLQHGADISQQNTKLQSLMEIVNPKCEIYRIIKSHLLSRPGGERKLRIASEQAIVATRVEQLPPDLRQLVDSSKLKVEDIEAHWEVFCNVIHFVGKKRIFATAEEAAQRAHMKGRATHAGGTGPTAEQVETRLASLFGPGDPKKIYKKLRIAGKGGFGMVFQGVGPDKKNWAIKRMPHSSDKEKRANLEEANFLRSFSHPNIVAYKAAYYCAEEREMWLIMELMEGGTLDEAVDSESKHRFEEKHLAFAAREILKGLEYLHGRGIVHRDLKAQNVMMSVQGEVKLIDFGLAVELRGAQRWEMCGSPYWLPPEMVLKQPHSYPVDIWSMGVCLLELANRHPPNNDSALRHLFNIATKRPPGLDKPEAWGDDMRDFLQCCLQQDPAKRGTAPGLLQHRFLAKAASQAEMAKLLKSVFIAHQMHEVALA